MMSVLKITLMKGIVKYAQVNLYSHITKFSPIFLPEIIFCRISGWVMDPFSPKFYSNINNNFGQNFRQKYLNFVMCEHSLKISININ